MESGVHLSANASLGRPLRQPHPLKFLIGSVHLRHSAWRTSTSFRRRLCRKTGVALCALLETTFTVLTVCPVRATRMTTTCFLTRHVWNVDTELHQMIGRAVSTLPATWRWTIVLRKLYASTCAATAVGTCVSVPWVSGATVNGALHGPSALLACRMKPPRPPGPEIVCAAR